jgi:hypothetical protein
MDIKAIQATINDHRTMISNIINNSINSSNIQQAVLNHYSNTAPVCNSWRDVALIFLLFIAFVQILCCCACQVKLRLWDYFVSNISRRHDTRRLQNNNKKRKNDCYLDHQPSVKRTNMRHSEKSENPFMVPKLRAATLEDDYAE